MKKYIFISILIILPFLKLNAQNEPNFAWAKNITSDINNGYGIKHAVTVDDEGNYYRAFQVISQSYNLEGIQIIGQNNQNGYPPMRGYFSKYDENDNILWGIPLTNILIGENSGQILVDNQGSIYFYGNFRTNPNQRPFLGDSLLTDTTIISPVNSSVSNGIFLTKISAIGEILWIKKNELFETSFNTFGKYTSLSFDLDGNVQLLNAYQGNVSFVPGDTLYASNSDEVNSFYVLYSPSGEVLQTRKLVGGTYNVNDPSASIYTETFKTDATGNIYRLNNRNDKTLFRYDSQGNFIDSLIINISTTSTFTLSLSGLAVNSVGDIYIGGYFFGNLTLGSYYFPHYGGGSQHHQSIIFKLEAPNYHIAWADTIKAIRKNSLETLKIDDLGNIYAIGAYSDLQEVATSFRKYTPSGNLLWNKPITGLTTPQTPYTGFASATSLALTQNGGNIWVSGKYAQNIYFASGYQFTTPNTNTYNAFTAQYGICNTPNPTMDMPITTQLCGSDSITLTATLNNTNGNYFWSTPSGDIDIDNNNPNATLTIGDAGKYSLILQEDEECYGKSLEIWITKVPLPDTSVTVQDNILTAVESAENTTYQWVDCQNNNTPISGATEQIFEPAENGEYAVIVTSENGCADTSSCHVISTLSVENNPMLAKQITLYPNPTSNEINVQTDLDVSEIYVLDLQGKQLQKTTSKEVSLSKLTSGIYLIKVKLKNNETWTSKVIKN